MRFASHAGLEPSRRYLRSSSLRFLALYLLFRFVQRLTRRASRPLRLDTPEQPPAFSPDI